VERPKARPACSRNFVFAKEIVLLVGQLSSIRLGVGGAADGSAGITSSGRRSCPPTVRWHCGCSARSRRPTPAPVTGQPTCAELVSSTRPVRLDSRGAPRRGSRRAPQQGTSRHRRPGSRQVRGAREPRLPRSEHDSGAGYTEIRKPTRCGAPWWRAGPRRRRPPLATRIRRTLPDAFGATVGEYRDWLVAELERFEAPVDLVGHDWGGGHVVNAAMARPDLLRSWATDVIALFDPEYVCTSWRRSGRSPAPARSWWTR